MKNILITGSNGQLGTAFKDVVSLLSSDNNYIFTDYNEFDICGSVEEITKFLTENKINIIVNCAAYTNVDKAQSDTLNCTRLNEIAPITLAKICKELDIYLIHISTDYVFDGKFNKPITEFITTNPLNHYGWTKRQAEIGIINSYCRYMIFRTSWLYYQGDFKNFINTIKKNLNNKIKVVVDQVGSPTYAGDLAKLIIDIIENEWFNDKDGRPNDSIYHFSNEGVCSWYDFAEAIKEFCNKQLEITPILSTEWPTLAKRPHFSVLDKSKVKKTFGIAIPYWKTSLIKMLSKS